MINIDAKLVKRKDFKIADRTYTVVISDKVDNAISNLVNIEAWYTAEGIEKKATELAKADTTTAEVMKDFMNGETDTLKNKVTSTLDVILGEAQGDYIYNYYSQSTKTLMVIIRLIAQELDDILIERKQYAQGKYSNRHQKNKK